MSDSFSNFERVLLSICFEIQARITKRASRLEVPFSPVAPDEVPEGMHMAGCRASRGQFTLLWGIGREPETGLGLMVELLEITSTGDTLASIGLEFSCLESKLPPRWHGIIEVSERSALHHLDIQSYFGFGTDMLELNPKDNEEAEWMIDQLMETLLLG